MTTFTQYVTETFHVVSCYSCGVTFGISNELHRIAVLDKKRSIYCPACGKMTRWTGKTEAEKVREEMEKKLDVAKRRGDRQEQRAEQAEKSLTATKGVVTKMKKRVSNGVCPCCNRNFKNLQRHMAGQHPDFEES